MTSSDAALLALLIFVAAALYSSVGHAGASGYLAAMALFGLAPAVMRPTALVLNILVASIASARFWRARCFSWSTLWPFTVGSIPLAFLGGALHLPGGVYRPVLGVLLLFTAVRLAWPSQKENVPPPKGVPMLPAMASGGGIGLLSGLTGTGGGIFLSPLLLFTGWAETRETAGVSAAFILLNSVAGLAGNLASVGSLPPALALWVAAAALGGLLGSGLGSQKLPPKALRHLLAVVLVVAGVKLVLT